MLPENIKERIIIDSILLQRNNHGWYKIHNYLKNNVLHLKKTNNIHHIDFQYHKIKRVDCKNGYLCMTNNVYTWINNETTSCKSYSLNDIYSMDDDEYFDDLIWEFNDTDDDDL